MGFEPFKSKARLFRKPRHCFPSKENPDVFPKHSQPRRFSGAPVLEAAWLSSCSKAGLSTSGAGTCPWALGSASTWVHGLKKKMQTAHWLVVSYSPRAERPGSGAWQPRRCSLPRHAASDFGKGLKMQADNKKRAPCKD